MATHLTKRDYTNFATLVADLIIEYDDKIPAGELIEDMCELFHQDFPGFDEDRWKSEVQALVEEGPEDGGEDDGDEPA